MEKFDFTKLKTDKVFFEANYPILYTCVDDDNALYLVVCCQNNANGKKWLVTGISEKEIIDMLENRVSVRNALMKSYGQKYTVCSNSGKLTVLEVESAWNEDNTDLPDIDSFLDPDPDEFAEELAYYGNRLRSNYNRENTGFREYSIDSLSDLYVVRDLTQILFTDSTVKCQNTLSENHYCSASNEFVDGISWNLNNEIGGDNEPLCCFDQLTFAA